MKFSILKLVGFAVIFAATPAALATTWYVDGATGRDGNNCKSPTAACKTIKHAISISSSGDSIVVAAATYTENLTISISLNVIGSGAMTTIIDGRCRGTVITISNTAASVTLSDVTLTNGCARNGGGIINLGTLRIIASTISRNNASGDGSAAGGGINNYGALTISNGTVAGNIADATCRQRNCGEADGGGVANLGTLTINNSTMNGNEVVTCFRPPFCYGLARGGGISNGQNGTLIINNSTLSGNFAVSAGGGIFGFGPARIQNSIVASNHGGNCHGNITSDGYNLSSDTTCNFNGPGDMNNTKPKLGSLQNNGGPTQTIALLPGSPAIDAGNPSGCTDGQGHLLKTDQRGMPRPNTEDKSGCDMGAYERQSD